MITAKLNTADLAILKAERKKRIKEVWKILLVWFILPIICGLAIVLFLNLISTRGIRDYSNNPEVQREFIKALIYPKSWGELYKYVVACYLFGYLVGIAAIFTMLVQFFMQILPVLRDIHFKTKRIYVFEASKYSLPEFGDYFIKTPLPDFPFFKVSHETYASHENAVMELELADRSNILLALKYQDTGRVVPVE